MDDFIKGNEKKIEEEKISLQDMMKINRRTQRMTILLISSLFFLMIGALAALFIEALKRTTASIEYMLYRYMAVGQYTSAPIEYWRLMIPVIMLIVMGLVLGASYLVEKWKEQRSRE
jgi:phosphatidylglycerophosphate synthase